MSALAENPICYSRVSQEEQAKLGMSLQAQALRLAAAQPGARLLSDEGVSAGVPLAKRPAGAIILESVENGTCKLVVCTRVDRLFRSAAEALTTVSYWQTKGVGLLVLDSSQGRIDTLDPGSWLMFGIICVAAEYEKNLIRQRTRETMQAMRDKTWISKRSGNVVTGFGSPPEYRHPPEVVAIIQAHAAAGLKSHQIAEVLNTEGPEPGARAHAWTASVVRGILKRNAS